jgi:hypothetical protein
LAKTALAPRPQTRPLHPSTETLAWPGTHASLAAWPPGTQDDATHHPPPQPHSRHPPCGPLLPPCRYRPQTFLQNAVMHPSANHTFSNHSTVTLKAVPVILTQAAVSRAVAAAILAVALVIPRVATKTLALVMVTTVHQSRPRCLWPRL